MTMENIKELDITNVDGTETYIVVERLDGSFETMLKAEYERRLAEQDKQSGTL